jgi:parallel beta-helix repeat protein
MNVKNMSNTLIAIGVMSTLIVFGLNLLVLPVDAVEYYEGQITINPDGSLTPSDAPVKIQKSTYTLESDVFGSIVILKSGIIFNGGDHSIYNSVYNFGIWLNSVSGVTVKNCHVNGFLGGLRLDYSSDNIVKSNVLYGNTNAGIAVMFYCNDNIFKDNEIYDNQYGIAATYYCNNNEFKDNYLHDNGVYAIRLAVGSNYNLIKNNRIIDNTYYGVVLEMCGYNTVKDNMIDTTFTPLPASQFGIYMSLGIGHHVIRDNCISDMGFSGIVCSNGNYNSIVENEVSDSFIGMTIWGSTGVELLSNEIHNCEKPGIDVENSNNIFVKYNTVNSCKHGLFLSFTTGIESGNEYIENTLQGNIYGVYIEHDTTIGNTFHHNNILDNSIQMYSDADDDDNTWDDGMGEGNYWSNYYGEDLDHDGIGDTMIPHEEVDYYPLMNRVSI